MTREPGRRSAGLVVWRRRPGRRVQVLLGHMGGPFWARKDAGAWTIPKGEYDATEEPLAAARREFAEELGMPAPAGEPVALGDVRQSGGKQVSAWAVEGDLDPADLRSNTFELEWPPRSGRRQSFPELDRADWFDLVQAGQKVVVGQRPLLDRLAALVGEGEPPAADDD